MVKSGLTWSRVFSRRHLGRRVTAVTCLRRPTVPASDVCMCLSICSHLTVYAYFSRRYFHYLYEWLLIAFEQSWHFRIVVIHLTSPRRCSQWDSGFQTDGTKLPHKKLAFHQLKSSPPGQIAAILQTILSDAFSWMKTSVFWLKFHGSLFLGVQLTITQHWFR